MTKIHPLILLVGLVLPSASCFPELPDAGHITNLRILGVRSEPAMAALDTFPLPTIQVSALVVDPLDPELDAATHSWELELGDGEGAEALAAMVPEGPYGPWVVIDPNRGFARDTQLVEGLLPLTYRVETADDHREAVKLLRFLTPAITAGDDDDTAAAGEEIVSNSNPRIMEVRANGELLGGPASILSPKRPLWLGDATHGDGVVLTVDVTDDGDVDDLSYDLYWTAGCPGLPPESGLALPGMAAQKERGTSQRQDSEGCPETGAGGFGSSFGYGQDDDGARRFAWTPPEELPEQPVRLFLVVRDGDGGQTWQELRLGGGA